VKKLAQTKDNRLKIYVSGPYSGSSKKETEENVKRAIDAGIQVWKRGHFPYIPHLTHYVKQRPTCDLAWEDFIQWDRPWLEVCDAVLLLGESRGAHLEAELAKSLGKRVYKSIEEVPSKNTFCS